MWSVSSFFALLLVFSFSITNSHKFGTPFPKHRRLLDDPPQTETPTTSPTQTVADSEETMILTILAVVCILTVMILILIPVIRWFRSSQQQGPDQPEDAAADEPNEQQTW
jgi:hypothetical protein